MYVCVCVCVCFLLCLHMCVYFYVCMYACMFWCIYVYMFLLFVSNGMHVCIQYACALCLCIYVYIYVFLPHVFFSFLSSKRITVSAKTLILSIEYGLVRIAAVY